MYSTEMHEARELGQEFRQLLMGYLRVRHSQNEGTTSGRISRFFYKFKQGLKRF
nr:MAG TPA: hypothetical protein [Caudoviricetes sp.]